MRRLLWLWKNTKTMQDVKTELIAKVLSGYPDMRDMDKEPIKTFGQFSCGIYDGWDWFDRNATCMGRDGKVGPKFGPVLRFGGHKFLQDATVEELEALIKVIKYR